MTKSGSGKNQIGIESDGYILVATMIISLIIISLVGYLYQQSIVQSSLANNLSQQIALYAECESLLPILRKQVGQESVKALSKPNKKFMIVKGLDGNRWEIDRSDLQNNMIRFQFHLVAQDIFVEPIALNIKYQKP